MKKKLEINSPEYKDMVEKLLGKPVVFVNVPKNPVSPNLPKHELPSLKRPVQVKQELPISPRKEIVASKATNNINIYIDSRRNATYYISDRPILEQDPIAFHNVNKPSRKSKVFYALIDKKKNKLVTLGSNRNNTIKEKRQLGDDVIATEVYEASVVEEYHKKR